MTGAAVRARPPTSAGSARNNEDSVLVADAAVRGRRRHGRPPGRRGRVSASPSQTLRGQLRRAPAPTALRRGGVATANDAVFERAGERPDLRGMGTTLVAVAPGRATTATSAWPWSTSATRASTSCRDGELSQLTDDHSLVEELVRDGPAHRRRGRASTRSATSSPGRSASTPTSTSTPGTVDPVRRRPLPALQRRAVQRGRRRPASPPSCAGSPTRTRRPTSWCALANEAGGRDNITVVVVDVVDDGDRGRARPRPRSPADRRRPTPTPPSRVARPSPPTTPPAEPTPTPPRRRRRAEPATTATPSRRPRSREPRRVHRGGSCCSSCSLLARRSASPSAPSAGTPAARYYVGFDGDQVVDLQGPARRRAVVRPDGRAAHRHHAAPSVAAGAESTTSTTGHERRSRSPTRRRATSRNLAASRPPTTTDHDHDHHDVDDDHRRPHRRTDDRRRRRQRR